MRRRLILLIVILISITSFSESVIGSWKCGRTIFKFYINGTGKVEDNIEGDSIMKWWRHGNTVYYILDSPYRDLDSLKIKNNLISNGRFKFRKI